VDKQKIIDAFLMPFFGFYAREVLGAICPPTTAGGKILTVVSVAGEIKGFGKDFWKNWWRSPILSG
jgi:hypothetical protein